MGSRIIGVGITGTKLTGMEKRILRETPPYAVVLFGRNVASEEQLRDLVAECKAQSSHPPLILIDEEGGRVDRLRNLIPGLPSAESFLEGERTRGMVEWFGRVIGHALRYFDIEVNLAPVVDVMRDPSTRGLERRCFGPDAETVIQLAGGFIRGHHATGSASCLKHFPGISRGSGDPHYGSTLVDISLEELEAEDLRPYVALGDLSGAVMIGHATYPQIEDPRLPASLSRRISTEILRDVVGFRGIAFSDDMEMHAVSDLGSYEEITDRALLAGNDVILFCSHIERVPELMEHMEKRAAGDPEFGPRLAEAGRRAEEYLRFVQRLRQENPAQITTFAELRDAVGEFVAEFETAGGEVRTVRALPRGFADRRRYPRYREDGAKADRREEEEKKGKGRSGREEWT
ncbi:MAG TPA: glycoside hydrolase family 3 N-terminal domain-containing protein [Thermoanaerobaculia bacterium]|nr:glycoside hydrolase family 3 N-terminal domain-containing protein [Thermoanaerobaculia bacterium]